MTSIALGGSGEFNRIRAIAAALGDAAGPLGDDTASIPAGHGALVVSTDVAVDGIHFRRDWLTAAEIGWRSTASALSDLAAAASVPAGVTAAVTVPNDHRDDDLVELMRGVGAAAQEAGCRVLGGDLSEGPALTIAITVFGHAERPMSRRGAKPGDGVWVTGALGGARAALRAWLDGRVPTAGAREAFAHPVPRLAMARWLAGQGATAMMDISDGLGGDAEHLAAASQVGVRLELERVPPHPAVADEAARLREDAALFAAIGGEDYELLVTMPREFIDAAGCLEATGVALTRVGAVRRDAGVVATLMGSAVTVPGYRHRI
ncbi:MAG: thiamine-phosphate kinase [Gemmatimonadota bacterium]